MSNYILIKNFYKSLQIPLYNLNISDISNHFNIELIYSYSKAFIIKNNYDDYLISLDIEADIQYQKVTFFHELAHFFLDHLKTNKQLSNYHYHLRETCTDEVSLLLAIPPHELEKFNLNKSDIIYELSELYNFPFWFIQKRLLLEEKQISISIRQHKYLYT